MKYSLATYFSKAFLAILDWDLVKKSQVILLYASFTAAVIYFIQIKYMYHPLANTELLLKLQWLYPGIFVLNTFLILFGFFIKNKPEAHIYYVYLPEIDMYKLGVTLDKEARFRALGEVQVIETKAMEYTEACKLEHLLMVKLDNYRYKGRQVLVKNGSTELFKQDVSKHIIRALQE